MINSKMPFIFYGGDYNPDQWPEDILKEDIKMLKDANLNIVTLPVFSWALLQPDEDTYDFKWLDNIFNLLKENDINVCLATSTAVQPAWMAKKYPEILPVDFNGNKRNYGGRVDFCPNSTKYREFSVKLVKKMAERYKDYDNLALWHIGNEYDNYCYCEHCEEEFKKWLKEKYKTLDNLNKAWNTNFWGHKLYSWDDITAPSGLSEMWVDNGRTRTIFGGMSLDYNRFMSHSILECYIGEYNAIKEVTPDIKVTTNFMGTYKPINYFEWAEYMDVISWDNYPSYGYEPYMPALNHDLMRSLKHKPFMLIEQSPNQANWQPYNTVKRPGELRILSHQALAHGSDSVMFIQMRQSIGGCEKYHGAVISHSGSNKTRIYKECQKIGDELHTLKNSILDAEYDAKVAIMFDWENWWALEFSSGPSIALEYIPQIQKYYKALFERNIPVEFVMPNEDLSKYKLVIAPTLYMVKENVADNIKNYVKNGGSFVTTFFSGYVNENDTVTLGGYPGALRDLLGIWVEELDALPPENKNSIEIDGAHGYKSSYSCNMLFDLINLEGAEAIGVYGSDFYKNRPVFTVNNFGKGQAYYIGTNPDDEFAADFIKDLDSKLLLGLNLDLVDNVEVTKRVKDGQDILFIINHNNENKSFSLDREYINLLNNKKVSNFIDLKPKDIVILKGRIKNFV